MRYQNGELKSVVSADSCGMDPENEEKFLYLDCYDRNYENESFETVINAAYQRGE